MRVFCSCSVPVHLPIPFRGRSFSLTPPLVQWPQLLASWVHRYIAWDLSSWLPCPPGPSTYKVLADSKSWVPLNYSVILRQQVGYLGWNLATKFPQKISSPAPCSNSPLLSASGFFPDWLIPSYNRVFESDTASLLLKWSKAFWGLHSQLWRKPGHLHKIWQLSWSGFEFSLHYHGPCPGLFTTLGEKRPIRFRIKAKVGGMGGNGWEGTLEAERDCIWGTPIKEEIFLSLC